MPNPPLRVLIVEDSIDDTFFIVRELQKGGFQVDFERVDNQADMQSALRLQNWDLVISDYRMPQFDGASALATYRQSGLDVPFIIVSGALGEDRAVEMLKAGAHDYVMKDELEGLVPSVERELNAFRERRIRKQTEASTAYLASIVQSCDDAIIGKNLEGIIVSWNRAAERLYGYSAVEMIGRPISVIVPRDLRPELSRILTEIRDGGHIEGLETVRLRNDGTPVEVSLTISPIRDSCGQVIGGATIARRLSRQNPARRTGRRRQEAAP
jgi:two-component system, cell cycle sensor histidine kinase and response regulator CckA